jgi:hypothetical protein
MLETAPVKDLSRSVDAASIGKQSRSRSCPVCGSIGGKVVSRDSNRRDGLSLSGAYVKCAG